MTNVTATEKMPDEIYLAPEWVQINDKAYLACWVEPNDGYTKYTRAKALDASETVDLSWIDGMRKPYGDFENPKCQCKTCQSKNGWNACIDAITGRLKGAGE